MEAALGTGLPRQPSLQLSLLWLLVRLGGAGSTGRTAVLSVAERSVLRSVGSVGACSLFLQSGRVSPEGCAEPAWELDRGSGAGRWRWSCLDGEG